MGTQMGGGDEEAIPVSAPSRGHLYSQVKLIILCRRTQENQSHLFSRCSYGKNCLNSLQLFNCCKAFDEISKKNATRPLCGAAIGLEEKIDKRDHYFSKGLSFGVGAMMTLDGTLLFDELMQAKEHLREQYNELFPALCNNHPDVFPEEFYSWEQFLWACELWYSNSLKIMFSDGNLRTCLVPIAGFLNHSLHPHILHYGKVDSDTNSLKFRLSRPCRAGEECYLSYGNYSGSHLVTFYGFLPEGDNLNDVIPLDIDFGDDDSNSNTSGWSTHMVRGTWLSKNQNIFHYGLPSPLLECLRKARCPELRTKHKLQESLENEMEVLNDLLSIFDGMMENLEDENEDRSSTEWDIKLALNYKDLQRRIVSSCLTSCHAGCKAVEFALCECMEEDTRG